MAKLLISKKRKRKKDGLNTYLQRKKEEKQFLEYLFAARKRKRKDDVA